jgi:AMMECR1 domain-containing protein
VALEVVHNAISAATRDPRFPPVQAHELPGLDVKVDVLTTPEPVSGPDELDPRRYGVIVQERDGWRRGLLLPDLEGIDTVEEQIRICRYKAGLGPDEPVDLLRFRVMRYT